MAAFNLSTPRLQGKAFTSTLAKPAALVKSHALLPVHQRGPTKTAALPELLSTLHPVLAAAGIDWSDPDVQIGALGAVLGLAVGIGAPVFYVLRTERDEERLEELRALNRATKEATGEYLSEEEIAAIRPPRWTDRREFVDDD